MKNILIGEGVKLDVAKLIESRLLIQSNSGGGKSHTVRRLLEQTHGQVQQIVLDPEGEFGTLREKFDYVLVGKGGDLPADTRSAALLAAKLLETGVSAVIDLYELHAQERKRFVRLFLEAMVNADKSLWHPVLVVVDEAHIFVPEHGEAESSGPVIDLCTRGRKRGFCAVLATQRLSKLHKDAAAECNNKLIGRTGLDIDMKRAADELGFGKSPIISKDGGNNIYSLRTLDPGEFFAYGPAISREVVKVHVGEVQTAHPKIGVATKVASPTPAIRSVLAKLGDLPKEAEAEARTIADLKRDLAEAKRHRCPETSWTDEQMNRNIAEAIAGREESFDKKVHEMMTGVSIKLKEAEQIMDKYVDERHQEIIKKNHNQAIIKDVPKPAPTVFNARKWNPDSLSEGDKKLSGAALKMGEVLVAYYPEALTVSRLCALSGYKPKVSTTRNALSILRTGGYLDEMGGSYAASETLRGLLPAPVPMTSEEKIAKWRGELSGASRAIFDALATGPSTSLDPVSVAQLTGIDPTKSTWRNAISQLNVRGLLKKDSSAHLSLVEDLFV